MPSLHELGLVRKIKNTGTHISQSIDRIEGKIENLSLRQKRQIYFVIVAFTLAVVGFVGAATGNEIGATVPLSGATASIFGATMNS
jgi:hypothetical protein